MSSAFQKVVNRLGQDLSFASQFLNSPALALEGYNLEPKEYNLLASRDLKGLQTLGLTDHELSVVASGAHSERCPR
jgi:hypothetical protein